MIVVNIKDFWNIKDLQYPSESFDIVESQCRSLQITLDTTNVIQWPPDFRKDSLGTTSPTESSHIVEVISQQAIAVVTPRECSFLWCNSCMISNLLSRAWFPKRFFLTYLNSKWVRFPTRESCRPCNKSHALESEIEAWSSPRHRACRVLLPGTSAGHNHGTFQR